ncbi:MAG: NADH-ubiquinone oxidoreductase-F iron-sulfur binding region domain-containing protein [Xanthomonadales bacterium]|nr:NADH-ubiquinone oxidoreductase-F iron-sulfur binding region domain-containing protein [Xanthomonadales bacterium]
MTLRVFVPADTTAAALGADAVAAAVVQAAARRGIDLELVRNGSRGAYWLEPLLEVEDEAGRRGFGPVEPEDVGPLMDVGFPPRGEHPLALGDVEALPWLADQTRVTFTRAGVGDPLSLEDYRAQGGFKGLERALALTPQQIVDEIKASGLRGRGGAAFPTGIKWQTVLDTEADQKYICCNADEGDSGTFADRLLMEADPFQLIEGMAIAGRAVGATRGFIYLRSEYPRARDVLEVALVLARTAGILGDDVLGSGAAFDIDLRLGANAYICGEETSMLDSLEGKRGLVRFKPPLPAIEGLFGHPTVVNNVLSLAAASSILAQGGEAYAAHGTGRSRGTLTAQLGGNIRHGGLVEVPYGETLRRVVEDFGGGTRSGRDLRAVQVGGPLGTYLPEALLETPLDYEAMAEAGGMLGHGGIVVFDDSVDMSAMARFAMEFCSIESCGKCTPCRVGSVRGVEIIDRIRAGDRREHHLELLDELCDTMVDGSLCAMGGLTPAPVRSALNHFPEDFQR